MAATVTIEGVDDIRAFLESAVSGRIRDGIRNGMHYAGQEVETEVKKAATAGFRHPTGRLASSIRYEIAEDGYGFKVGVIEPSNGGEAGSVVAYARIRDEGGVITAKGGGSLAFPTPDSPVLTKAGVGGVRARDFISSPEQFGFASTFPSKSGRAIMGVPIGGGDAIPVFVLTRSVRQRGTGYLSRTVPDVTPRIVQEQVINGLREVWGG